MHGNLRKPYLPEEYPGMKFRYSKLKETAELDGNGNVIINRVPEEEKVVNVVEIKA